MPSSVPETPSVISVGELNRLARIALERALPSCWVSGEISNLSRPASGHWYFTLKDAQAAVRCVMFRARNQFVDWSPRDGERVEIRAQPTLYEARGDYQLNVDAMRHGGQGNLFEAFLRLKARLEDEGLFSPDKKRPLPTYPQVIGIITSLGAAALKDALSTLRGRWPSARIILYPASVQGASAPEELARALSAAGDRMECEVLLLIRGGGSLEDLNAYNQESLTRAIAACPLPVIAGIGHETDFSIADFVADQRAPTPTGAAQIATPDMREVAQHLTHLASRIRRTHERSMRDNAQHLDGLTRRLLRPSERLMAKRERLQALKDTLTSQFQSYRRHARHRVLLATSGLRKPTVESGRQRLSGMSAQLHHVRDRHLNGLRQRLDQAFASLKYLNPEGVLTRGFCIARDEQGGVVRHATDVAIGDNLTLTLAKGGLVTQILRKNK